MFGGGGVNPRKMKKMMEQMGIDIEEIDAKEVVIRKADGENLVFSKPEVTRMDAQGQQTYQVIGEPETQAQSETGTEESDASTTEPSTESSGDIPQGDIEIVAQRTGVSEQQAREALEATNGDLAAAVERLE
ncbi:MAG: nascent polypeptide-associated complex protein [Halobacteriaceae archaeon]